MKLIIALVPFLSVLAPSVTSPKRGHHSKEITPSVSRSSNEKDALQSEAQGIADGYMQTLSLTSWSMELSEWIKDHGYKGTVDTSHDDDYAQWQFEKYCFRTEIKEDGRTASYSFFANSDYSTPVAVLQQVYISDLRTEGNSALEQKVWDIVSDSLTKEYGPASKVPDDDLLSPFDLAGMPGEKDSQLWQDSVKRIVLAEDNEGEGNFIVILAREKSLDSLIHLSRKLVGDEYGAFISQLCDSLRPLNTPFDFFCDSIHHPKTKLEDLVRCGKFVSQIEHSGDSVHLPLYSMALYFCGRWYNPPGEGLNPTPEVDTLKRYNIIFETNPLGGGWSYSDTPLVSIYNKYPDSYWGQLAFVVLQKDGWCLNGGMCNGNYGPEVISKGEAFLSSHLKCVLAPAILLTIAEGYETNWNVSTSDMDPQYMDNPGIRDDQDSRVKAIATYEEIITDFPSSNEAKIARLEIPRLKLGINTGRRGYFFVYD